MKTINISRFIIGIAVLLTMPANAEWNGYYIPCGEGSDRTCICDVGTCRDFGAWDDSIQGFICYGEGKTQGGCTCTDASINQTFNFKCGCHTDDQCLNSGDGTHGYFCNTTTHRCESCSCNPVTGTWTALRTGYQYRTNKDCHCNTKTEYRCAAGYYGTSSNGTSGCTQCPTWSGVYTNSARTTLVRGTSSAGATAITGCYVVAGTYYDTTGTFKTTGNCQYK